MSCPQVSVVVPTYNRAPLIRQALDSIVAQTFSDYEIIVVDDGSTDQTAKLVEDRPEPIRYFRQEHRGVAAARNHAIRVASGEFVAFLDSDDVWLPDFLSEIVAALDAQPDALLGYSDFRTIDAIGRVLAGHRKHQHGGHVVASLFASIFIHTSCVVARRKAILDVSGFDEQFEASEDYDLWLRLSLVGPFASVTKPLCLRRTHNGSLSRNGNIRNLVRKAQLLEGFFDEHGNGQIPKDLASRRLAKTYYAAGKASALRREYTQSVELFRRSMRYSAPARAWPWYLVSLALKGTSADRGRDARPIDEQGNHSDAAGQAEHRG